MKPPVQNLQDEARVKAGAIYDQQAADKVKRFMETVGCITERCHGGDVGDPLKVIPWQFEEIIRPIHAWRDNQGAKFINEVGIWLPKKQNKSGLVALLALYHILVEEPAAYAILIASKVDQAQVLFNFAANTLRYGKLKSHLGRDRIWIRDNIYELRYTNRDGVRSRLKVMSSTPEGISGPSSSLTILEELAEYNGTNAQIIWDRLSGAGMARGGTKIVLSTPQFEKEHIGFHRYTYAKQVADGVITDPHFLSCIHGVPDDAKCICDQNCGEGWQCLEQVYKANPSVGITVPHSFYSDFLQKVKNNPREESAWRTLYCGQWVGTLDQWISHTQWAECKEDFNEEDLYGSDAYVGIDASLRNDLFAYTITVKRDDQFYLIPRFFIARDLAEKKTKEDHCNYTHYSTQGHVILTGDDKVDFPTVREHLMDDSKNFNFVECRYDEKFMQESAPILEAQGLFMVAMGTSMNVMGPPSAYFERLITEKKIKHNGQPLMDYCIGNTTPYTDNEGRVKPDKKRSRGRIDGVTATVISLSGWLGEDLAGDCLPMVLW